MPQRHWAGGGDALWSELTHHSAGEPWAHCESGENQGTGMSKIPIDDLPIEIHLPIEIRRNFFDLLSFLQFH